ncbi:Serine/threonine-protein kinase PknB [Roseimaritima multifibrata]|uniref:Serine/threonine-protein kinase PknB n=2 Tax=Roseimaritima multifibrata TaxID=1930274 RepID=A0A517MNP2_9BACT|nr:Serine/threonine-protein kinase PknB [Roseimaritima multifibrata]
MQAIEIDDFEERHRFVERACGSDETMLVAVRKLLSALDREDCNVLDEVVDCFAADKTQGMTQGASVRSGFWPESTDVRDLPQIDRYKICELIGEGGMGTVYVAQQDQPVRRKVALKVIRAGIATRVTLARFSAERQALAMMDHPNIAKIFDGGTTAAGQPYLVMELVQGLPLTKYVATHSLGTDELLRLFVKVCRAVQHAHQKGVIHRDLKPSNILVSEIDDEAVPKVIDFGLAKALDLPLTDSTIYTGFAQMMGTPMYMSPEQAEMGVIDIDTRSDVYSLGVLLYELVVGVPPFERKTFKTASFDEVRRIIRDVQPSLPSVAVSTLQSKKGSTISRRIGGDRSMPCETIRGELDWLIMKALEKDRRRRYESASELADDIQRFLSGEAVLACPPSRIYQLRKTFQRHRVAISAAALVLFSLIVISFVSIWQVIEVGRAKTAIELRERRVSDLLESNQLLSATSAYRTADFVQLAQLTGESLRQRESLPAGESSTLLRFLHSASYRLPRERVEFSSPVHEIAISPTESHAVCVFEDGNVTLISLDGSTTEPRRLGGHGKPVHAVAFSPDGTKVVSGSSSGVLKFWDVDQATCDREIKIVSTGIESLVWSPNGESIAAGARYSGVWVGDALGNEKFRFENDQRHESLLFSGDSRELFVPTREGIHVWDVASGECMRSIDTNPFSNIRAMCWAGSNRQWLVVGERYHDSLAVFDPESGARRGTFNVSVAYAKSLAASSDGMWVTAGYGDGRVQVIRLSGSQGGLVDGKVQAQWHPHNQDDSRLALDWFSGGSSRFVTAGSDGAVQLWDRDAVVPGRELASEVPLEAAYLLDNLPEPVSFPRNQAPVNFPQLAFSLDAANGLVAFGSAKQVAIVSLRTRQPLATLKSPLTIHKHLALSSDGSRLAAVGDGQVSVWKSNTRWASHQLVAKFATANDSNVVFADQNQTLICGNEEDTRLQEVNIESGQVKRWHAMTDPDVVAISNDQRLIAAGNDICLTVWDRESDAVLLDIRKLSSVWALRFLHDDRVLVSGHNDGRIMAWHVPTGHPLGILYHPRPGLRGPRSIQLSADGQRMILTYPSNNGYIPVLLGR